MNDVWWTRGGHGGGGGCPSTNSCVINDRVSFLLVKLSIVDLANIWDPGYRWSARW